MHSLTHTLLTILFSWLLLLPGVAAAGLPVIHHQLNVTLSPQTGEITVTDNVTLPPQQAGSKVTFRLHPDLEITHIQGAQRTPQGSGRHTVQLDPKQREFTLQYKGKIRDALSDISDAAGKTQHSTHGWIGAEGVFLNGAAPWYPLIPDAHVSFDLSVTLPAGWTAISQGRRLSRTTNHWEETHPQDDIYLLAGEYNLYESKVAGISAQVYLHQPDPELAQRYLDATHRYIQHYNTLLGHYPYRKFALVENFWESGYGMPSFTLLGPTVIRLPFIIHTSYPHEILHNWFGNGVFVDYSQGNWSEGLTTYLADHHLREQQGKAAAYRHDTLQNFAHHATADTDFPLLRFRGRHGDSSQAVGYGKSMMFFHMLRKKLGDEIFYNGLREFYRQNLFRQASYHDLRTAWEEAGKTSLEEFFRQWLNRTGAPRLAITKPRLGRQGKHFLFTARLKQTQSEPAFPMSIPVTFHFADEQTPVTHMVPSRQQDQPLALTLPARPVKVTVDAEFDCFRQLYPQESPATLSAIFGSREVTIILPSAATPELLQHYRSLTRQWLGKREGSWKTVRDDQIKALPKERDIILLGWENRFRKALFNAHRTRIGETADELRIQERTISKSSDSVALALGSAGGRTTLFIATGNSAALPGLARKLPHYGKYGLLAFAGDAPDIRIKTQWEITDSPLQICFNGLEPVSCINRP